MDALRRKNKAPLPVRYDLSRLPKVEIKLPVIDDAPSYDDPDIYIDDLPPDDTFFKPPGSNPRQH